MKGITDAIKDLKDMIAMMERNIKAKGEFSDFNQSDIDSSRLQIRNFENLIRLKQILRK